MNFGQIIFRNAAVQFIARFISAGCGIIITALLARYLGVDDFGLMGFVFAFFSIFMVIGACGMDDVSIRIIQQSRFDQAQVMSAAVMLKTLIYIALLLAACIGIGLSNDNEQARSALFAYALILPLQILKSPSIIYRSTYRLDRLAWIEASVRFLSLPVTVVIMSLGGTLTHILLGFIFAELLGVIGLWKGSGQRAWQWRGLPRALWKELLSYGGVVGLIGIASVVINRMDFIMLEHMTSPSQLGLYSAAYRITDFIETFPIMLMATLYPRMASLARDRLPDLKKLFFNWTLGLALPAAGVTGLIFVSAYSVMKFVFGESYASAGQVLQILLGSSFFVCLALPGGSLLISMGKARISLTIVLIALIINLMLNMIWIPSHGCVGAAWATLVSYGFIFVSTLIACIRLMSHHV